MIPPEPEDCENVTVPVGDDPPETVAVQELVVPTTKEVGEQEIEAVVGALLIAMESV